MGGVDKPQQCLASDGPVHIALASDRAYYFGLLVTACSIAENASRAAKLWFHILDGGIGDETFAEFRVHLGMRHPNIIVERHPINEQSFKDCAEYAGSRLTYARLLLPELLNDVPHVIYCDCDFLWRADILDLWKERDDSIILQSTQNRFEKTERRERAWFTRNGYEFSADNYFCAGLSFFNLEMFRRDGIAARAFEFLKAHQDVIGADQTAMNALLYGRVRLLSRKWQTLTCSVTAEELCEPIVLHYADEIPWKRPGWWRLLTDAVMLWHRYNDTLLGTPGGSLASFFSLHEIVFKRSLDRLLQFRAFRRVFYLLLTWTGRGSYADEFDIFSRNLDIDKVK